MGHQQQQQQFIYSSKSFKTKVGPFVSTATANVYRSSQFKNTMKSMQSQCYSPDEVIFGPDFHQSLYCHLLCGLIYRDEVQVVFAPFAHSSIIHAFRTFEHIWEDLCNDIRDGVLSSRITVPSIRAAMSKILNPDLEMADLIHKMCLGLSTNWYGVMRARAFSQCRYFRHHMLLETENTLLVMAKLYSLFTAASHSKQKWVISSALHICDHKCLPQLTVQKHNEIYAILGCWESI